MVFICHSASKTWLSICTQDIVKLGLHYQIDLIGLELISISDLPDRKFS